MLFRPFGFRPVGMLRMFRDVRFGLLRDVRRNRFGRNAGCCGGMMTNRFGRDPPEHSGLLRPVDVIRSAGIIGGTFGGFRTDGMTGSADDDGGGTGRGRTGFRPGCSVG